MCWLLFFSLQLANFVGTVRDNYKDNPYHSFYHAFDVAQTLFAFVYQILEVWRCLFLLVLPHSRKKKRDGTLFSQLECCAMLLAALCHDIGHPAKTNQFLIATSDKVSLFLFFCLVFFNDFKIVGAAIQWQERVGELSLCANIWAACTSRQ